MPFRRHVKRYKTTYPFRRGRYPADLHRRVQRRAQVVAGRRGIPALIGGGGVLASVKAGAFPPSAMVRLTYSSRETVQSTVGALGVFRWRGNSLYDPNRTGAGGQPLGRDQWGAFYKTATVLASSIRLMMLTTTNDASMVVNLSPMLSDAYLPTDIEECMEQRNGTSVIVSYLNGQKILKQYMKSSRIFAQPHILGDGTKAHEMAVTNPDKEWFWALYVQDALKAASIQVQVYVTIKYYVQLSERIVLLGS